MVGSRTVFLGTPEFSVPALEALAKASTVVLVITQPDRPAGRGRRLEPPPVKQAALRLGIPCEQPSSVKGRRFARRVAELRPDFLITAAYGKLLGRALLATPRHDALNVHASLLPRYRGAAPVARAILAGDHQAGVSIMRMAEGLDSGPVFLTRQSPIGDGETTGELTERLAVLGAEALVATLDRYDSLSPVEQDHDAATWAPPLSKPEGRIDWRRPAIELHAHVRGMHPWPCAFTDLEGSPLKVHRAQPLESGHGSGASPGTVIGVGPSGVDVACGDGALRLTRLQAAGKKALNAAQFVSGMRITRGTALGET